MLKLKRGALFCFILSFFLFPSQNYYSLAQESVQPVLTRSLGDLPPLPVSYPYNFTGTKPPALTANSVVVLDRHSAVLLYGKNERAWFLPASTTKIMTGLVALDHYQPEEVLTVGLIDDFGQDMNLIVGEQITVKNLLYGLLVGSANDAALVLAQNYPGGQTAFVKAMNQKAQELNLEKTYFANPTGLDSDKKEKPLINYSHTTALDLAHLALAAMKNDAFAQIVAVPKIVVTDISGRIKHELYNLNQLLGKVEGVQGVKTGWTEAAGECLVSYTEREGRGVLMVILGSEDRFGETEKLINWVFANFIWQDFTPSI